MLNKKLSFMLITDSRDKLRHFQLSYRFILGCAILAAFLFVTNILLTTSFVKSQVSAMEIKKLKAENEQLTKKFESLHGKVSEITAIYDQLVEKEVVIRNIFNLPEIDPEERQLGIGGPTTTINYGTVSGAVKAASSTETQVESLLRLANFEKEKYEEVYNTLEKKKDQLDHTPSIMPVRGYVSRGFGMMHDPFTGNRQPHTGIDIANRTGTPIFAPADGMVTIAGFSGSGLGNMVELNHGNGLVTRYGHMSRVKAIRGQLVKRGTLIGYVGSTGYSTGPHLHYEVMKNGVPVNPADYIVNLK
ncbi:putative Peptidase, M23/M37 family [Candidatus Zixiibacteriota bacterium]|nr:putative Peptidase, M23/M37 family [candidate division Zixibacteria bacterium]